MHISDASEDSLNGFPPRKEQRPRRDVVNKVAIAKSLVDELETKLPHLEAIDALIAAAHVDAAINALCKEFDITRDVSDPD
jgi:hypothetical protein